MALPQFPAEITQLLHWYDTLEDRLVTQMVNATLHDFTRNQAKTLYTDLQAQMAQLDREAAQWDASTIPAAYHAGAQSAHQKAQAVNLHGPAPSFTEIPSRALRQLAKAATGEREALTRGILRQSHDYLRELTSGHLAEGLGLGTGSGGIGRQLREALIDRARGPQLADDLAAKINTATGVIYRDGSVHSFHEYAQMAALTGTAAAANAGQVSEYLELGAKYLRVDSHGTICPQCAPLEGKVFAVDAEGESQGYPLYTTITLPVHPRCAHGWSPCVDLDKRTDKPPPEYALNNTPKGQREMRQRYAEEHPKEYALSKQGFASTGMIARYKAANPDVPEADLRGPRYRYAGINSRRQSAIATMLQTPGLSYRAAVSRETQAFMATEKYHRLRPDVTPHAQRIALYQ